MATIFKKEWRKRFGYRDTDTQGGSPGEEGHRGSSAPTICLGNTTDCQPFQKPEERHGADCPSVSSEEINPTIILILEFHLP